jgi:plastocyanin
MMRGMSKLVCWMLAAPLLVSCVFAQNVTLTAHVALVNAKGKPQSGQVVLWLEPVGTTLPSWPEDRRPAHPPQLVQHNKSFHPHLLVVPVGSMVRFPNHDPFFHNVFSLYEGKRFNLGLYEAGSTRDVRFDKPGVSYIFCNIHAEMSAVVIALNTPYYGISDKHGRVLIPRVPSGRYTLHTWYEAALPDTLNSLTREITVTDNQSSLGLMRLAAVTLPETHKNMYGHDYEPPDPPSPAYDHP